MTPAKHYDLKRVLCIVGSFTISGYGEDGGIETERLSEHQESGVSADGQPYYSAINDNRVKVTITVGAYSRAARDLHALFKAQRAGQSVGGVLTPLAFALIDPGNGDKITDPQAVFMQTPTPSKAKSLGEVEFVLELPNGGAPGAVDLATLIGL